MNYKKIYNNLVNSRKYRESVKTIGYELHHIVPKCLGGSDDKDNLVLLTPREHYLAHLLLLKFKTTNKAKLACALNLMSMTRIGIIKNSKLYEICKNEYSKNHISKTKKFRKLAAERGKKYIGNKNPMYGKKHSIETKKHYSEIRTGIFWGKRKITDTLKKDIYNLYNSHPDVGYFDGKKSKNGKFTSYNIEFSKKYCDKFNLSSAGLLNFLENKYKNATEYKRN